MSASRWNPRVYPAGGWQFTDSANIKHLGTSLPTLVNAVREFRNRNALPPGSPEQEVVDQLCKRFPHACTGGEVSGSAVRPAGKEASGREKLALSVVVWLSKVARAVARVGKPDQTFATKTEAERRAAICAECPKQTRWDTNCGSCGQGHRRMSFALRRGRDVDNPTRLLACSVLAEDTRLSVFLENLQPVKSDDLPENCWRKEK